MRYSTIVSAVVIGAMVTVQGCAGGPGSLRARYADASDVCYAQRQPLIETESRFSESMLVGGAGGAVAGAAIGGAASHSAEGALIGAAIGAAAGLLGGYLYAKERQARDRQQLLASIEADAARDNRQIARSNSALDRLVQCRQGQIDLVAAQYQGKQLTAPQARSAYERIAAQMAVDDSLIGDVLGKSRERAQTYVSARAKVVGIEPEPVAAQPPPVVQPAPQAAQPAPSVAPPTSEAAAFARATREAEAKEQQHKRLRADVQTRINELAASVG